MLTTPMRFPARLVLFVCLAVSTGFVETAAQRTSPADPCDITGVTRIVAVGDVHGAYDGLVRILRAAKIIDGRDRWIGGSTFLVQTGDIFDRGAEPRKAIDLLRKLERDAPKSRGRVLALLGNHEVMRMLGDLRDMNPAELDSFRNARSEEIRAIVRENWLAPQRAAAKTAGTALDEVPLVAKFNAETPLGLVEMLQAYGPQGDHGKWLRSRAAVARVNGIVFLHGGISPRVAPLGCEAINAGIRDEITTNFEATRTAPLGTLAASEDGPLWFRGLAREDEAYGPTVQEIATAMGARAIVIGHTVTEDGRIRPRFGGLVVQIDTGMLTSVYKNGRPSALEIVGDTWTAIYEDGRQPLPITLSSPAHRVALQLAGAR
jgi:hypothetical protein